MNLPALKASLTRAQRSKDHAKVIAAVNAAVDAFDAPDGFWPDDWTRWARALDDFRWNLPRELLADWLNAEARLHTRPGWR